MRNDLTDIQREAHRILDRVKDGEDLQDIQIRWALLQLREL